MLYPLPDILLIALVMTFGSVVQGAVGFASGLIGVPLLVLCGFTLPEAATVNLTSTSMQNIIGAWKLWSHLEPRELILPVAVRSLTIPLGAYTAWLSVEYLDPARSKQILGIGLLMIITLMWLLKVPPQDRIRFGWQTLAFAASGFMLGFAAIGGAPMVIYVNSLQWSASKSRGFLFFCSAAGLPLAAGMYWYKYGGDVLPALLTTLLVLPLIFAGLWCGLLLGHRLSKPLFRRLSFALLIAIALASILQPFWTPVSEAL